MNRITNGLFNSFSTIVTNLRLSEYISNSSSLILSFSSITSSFSINNGVSRVSGYLK